MRVRAQVLPVHRFCAVYLIIINYLKAIEEDKLKAKVAERYIFPLALGTLMDKELARQTQLLTNAIELIGSIAQRMSWNNFRKFKI